jgi:hypothetical protein
MSTVTIQTEQSPRPKHRYRAIAGGRQYFGSTMGQALDALTADWGDSVREAAILIQRFEPDEFFTEAQQLRKRELMARRAKMSPAERAELETILNAELDATVARTDQIVRASGG